MNESDASLIDGLESKPCRPHPTGGCWEDDAPCHCKLMAKASERIKELSAENDKLTKNNARYHDVANGYANAMAQYAELLEDSVLDLRRVLEKMERVYREE